MTDLEFLKFQLSSMLVLDDEGRIVRENDPDRSSGPRAILTGCVDGNLCLFRRDVADEQETEIRRLFASEPRLSAFGARPLHIEAYRAILGDARAAFSVNYHLPNDVRYPADAEIVCSGTADGTALYKSLERDGIPPGMRALGFAQADELWRPWCAVMREGEIASLGFTARLGSHGADLGLVTVERFRGRGLGAAATAAWAGHPDLADRVLFYSTDQSNVSSQRVTQRLGLRLIGSSCRLS